MSQRDFNEVVQESEKIRDSNDKIENAIKRQIEDVRIQMGFTQNEFCQLLDTPRYTYTKLMTQNERHLPFRVVLTFCRLFGYDFSELISNSYLDSTDTVVRETAMFLSMLNKSTLDSIREAIEKSEESEKYKARASQLLQKMKYIQQPETTFFAADYRSEK